MGQDTASHHAGTEDAPADCGYTRSAPFVHRLDDRHVRALAALLDTDPGASLFLRSNLDRYGMDSAIARYWGAFEGVTLRAAAMLVGHRTALYAPRGVDVAPLSRAICAQGVEFTMGRVDLVDALLAEAPFTAYRREEHYLAGLAQRPYPQAPLPDGITVRRTTPDDLDALTRLYLGTEGFEELSEQQVRQTMRYRIQTMRTHVLEVQGVAVAGASTSAESAHAAMVGGVWTVPAHRNRGYATAVVTRITEELAREGRRPYLFYLTHNAPAARVYGRVGFRPTARWSVAYLDSGRSQAI